MACRRRRRMASAQGYKQEGCRLTQQGGTGVVVVRARHRATGRAVAVKSLHRRSGRSYVGDVLREACFTAAGGGHTFRTVARRPGTMDYSIVMDYVGPSLRAVMVDRGDRPLFMEAEVRRIMRKLLAGAEVMHGRGIVHRDIRPDNIFVGDGAGDVKFCNYGAAKSMFEKDPPCYGYPAGTCAYVAPEVLVRNAGHGAPVDAWSLGCVMAELLTGEPPFLGEDETNQLFKIFDVVGVPCRREWEALKPQVRDDKVRMWWAQQRQRGGLRNRLRGLVPEETLSGEGFQVLQGLLRCDPEKRLTAASALRCPWFTENVDEDPVSGRIRVAKITGMASKSCSLAMSFVGCALGFLRLKSLRL
ncbi:putative cyclin-dependent kinase F-2 [Setaria italica]|nr:putative cyclin-dependent kinase F-2 [Setaria italica]XP_034591705.1 putative cyclin-dependent kinase F-2 [Setaria viridis]